MEVSCSLVVSFSAKYKRNEKNLGLCLLSEKLEIQKRQSCLSGYRERGARVNIYILVMCVRS